MQVIQLYIGTDRVDLFKDESINITQSIKDVRDVSKVFIEFTKRFTVPASKNNNKIFKHYYNFDIVGGFDARKKTSASIELNHLPFKEGKIKLDSVELKEGKPYSYKVTFFGNAVQLKDLFGEDKLSDISELDELSGDPITPSSKYNADTVYSLMKQNPASKDFIVPLITHTQRLYYDSSETVDNVGNLYQNTQDIGSDGRDFLTGVEFDNLKPAIRVHRIIEKIEAKYDITFSTDFFSSSQTDYYMLFLWMHRKKGFLTSGNAFQKYENIVTGLSPNGTHITGDVISQGDAIIVTQAAKDNFNSFSIDLTKSSGSNYNLRITRNDIVIYSQNDISGNSQINTTTALDGGFLAGTYRIIVEVLDGQSTTFSNISFQYTNNSSQTDNFQIDHFSSAATFQAVSEFQLKPTQQIPEMRVIDFLSGIFKMFNLIAYVDDAGTIVVKTLDDFYAASDANTYDISEYVDSTKMSVEPALPFKQIDFKYKDTKAILAANHKQFFNQDWGGVEYDGTVIEDGQVDNTIYGDVYKVEIPFSLLKYERLINNGNSTATDFQVGYFVDDNQDAYFGSPLVFYPIYINPSENFTLIKNFIGTGEDRTYDKTVSTGYVDMNFDTINMPSNTLTFTNAGTGTYDNDSLHFNLFPDEYNGSDHFSDTLFKKYYETYIKDKFEIINRLTKVTAYLPVRILRALKMNDRFTINGVTYRINKISSDLKNGKSKIELLND